MVAQATDGVFKAHVHADEGPQSIQRTWQFPLARRMFAAQLGLYARISCISQAFGSLPKFSLTDQEQRPVNISLLS